jgi:hypothetical protein
MASAALRGESRATTTTTTTITTITTDWVVGVERESWEERRDGKMVWTPWKSESFLGLKERWESAYRGCPGYCPL